MVKYFLTLLVLPLPLSMLNSVVVMKEKMLRRSRRAERFIVALWMATLDVSLGLK